MMKIFLYKMLPQNELISKKIKSSHRDKTTKLAVEHFIEGHFNMPIFCLCSVFLVRRDNLITRSASENMGKK